MGSLCVLGNDVVVVLDVERTLSNIKLALMELRLTISDRLTFQLLMQFITANQNYLKTSVSIGFVQGSH